MRRAVFGLMPPRAIPVTTTLSAILLGVSLIAAITGQRGVGLDSTTLNFRPDAIFNLELWRLVTYPFVASSTWSLLLDILMLWIFGGWFETAYGRRDYLRFFFASAVFGALLAIPLSYLVNLLMLFHDPGMAEGPNAVIDAMLVAFALALPDSNVLFGFVLPMRTRTIIFVILGIQVIGGIMNGAAALSITLGGMLMGYLLVTGHWRPRRLLNRVKLWRMKKRRRGLYVVPPKDKTLH